MSKTAEFFQDLQDLKGIEGEFKTCNCGQEYTVVFYDAGRCPDCQKKAHKALKKQRTVARRNGQQRKQFERTDFASA